MIKKFIKSNMIKDIIAIIIIIILEIIFFRNIVCSSKLIGDIIDARLNNLIVEHWFQFFCGNENLNNLNIFYPIENTLSYTDMLLGLAIPYSLLRLFGMNMFLANKIVLILTHVIGSLTLYYLFKNKFKCNILCSLIGMSLFSYSSAYYTKTGHTQLFTISLLPIFIYFIYNFFENLNVKNSKIRYAFGTLSCAMYILIMYTSFYIAWFTALFICILSVIFIILLYFNKINGLKLIWNYVKLNFKEILFYILFSIICVIPFFLMYIPTLKLFGARGYPAVMLPNLIDFFNVSPENLILGKLIRKFVAYFNINGEHFVGFSIITIILFIYALFLYFRKTLNINKSNIILNEDKINILLNLSVIVSILISFILLFQNNYVSLWFFVYKLFPGGSAIRAPIRYNMFLTLPISIVVANMLMRLKNKSNYKLIFIFGLTYLFNFNIIGVYSYWNINDMNKFLESVPEPPSNCKIIYIIDSNKDNKKISSNEKYNLDAWMIANKYNLKTINGYSGQGPYDWNAYLCAGSKDISIDAENWKKKYNIEGLYYYDLATNEWIEHKGIDAIFDSESNKITINNGIIDDNNEINLIKNGYIEINNIELPQGEYLINLEGINIDNLECILNEENMDSSLRIIKNKDMEYKLILDKSSKFKFIINNINFDLSKFIRLSIREIY